MPTIRIEVLYFGMARDAAGSGEEQFSFPKAVSIDDLLSEAEKRHSGLARLRRLVRVAVNEELINGEVSLHDGDVVAVLPPVAGG